MRSYMWIVTAVAVLALTAGMSVADPYLNLMGEAGVPGATTNSWIGSTGLIMTPTATIAAPGSVIASYHYLDTTPNKGHVGNLNVGFPGGFEIGAAWLDNGFTGNNDEAIVNIKYNANLSRWFRNADSPAIAIGAWDITNEVNRSYYVVLSTDVPVSKDSQVSAARLSLGFADSDANTGRMDGIFGGVEFVPFRWGLVKAEYDGDDFNVGVAYQASDWASLEVASLDGRLGFGINAWLNW